MGASGVGRGDGRWPTGSLQRGCFSEIRTPPQGVGQDGEDDYCPIFERVEMVKTMAGSGRDKGLYNFE